MNTKNISPQDVKTRHDPTPEHVDVTHLTFPNNYSTKTTHILISITIAFD